MKWIKNKTIIQKIIEQYQENILNLEKVIEDLDVHNLRLQKKLKSRTRWLWVVSIILVAASLWILAAILERVL